MKPIRTTRRNFLQTAALGAAAAFKLPWLAGCCSTFPAPGMGQINEGTLPEELSLENAKLLELAARAPSSHNAQPWRIRIDSPSQWTLIADPDRTLPVIDPENRELFLSLGTFLESLNIAAGARGKQVSISTIANDPFAREVATITIEQGSIVDYPVENLEKRCIVRSGLSSGSISDSDIASLVNAADGQCHYFGRGTSQADYLDSGTLEAFKQQTWNNEAQAELASWTRLLDAEALNKRDGLTPATMGISGMAGCFVRTFGSDVMGDQYRIEGIKKTGEQLKGGGGWFVMTTSGSDVESLINSGRRFQRVSMNAYENRIGVHPMTQMLEESPWKEEVASQLGITGSVQWLLRIGYVKSYPAPASLRRPVQWFIETT